MPSGVEKYPWVGSAVLPMAPRPWDWPQSCSDVSQEAQVLKQLVSMLPCPVSCLAGWL